MTTLEDLRNVMNQFLTSAIEATYNHWQNPKDLSPIANELIKAIKEYVEESDKDVPERKQTNN